MLRLFLLGFLAPQLLFFFGELVPAVADDAADVAMVVFDGLCYFLFGPELRAEDHEGVAGSRDAVTRSEAFDGLGRIDLGVLEFEEWRFVERRWGKGFGEGGAWGISVLVDGGVVKVGWRDLLRRGEEKSVRGRSGELEMNLGGILEVKELMKAFFWGCQ